MKFKNYIALSLLAGMAAACDYTDLSPLDSFTDQTYCIEQSIGFARQCE